MKKGCALALFAALASTGCAHPKPGDHRPFPFAEETYGPEYAANPAPAGLQRLRPRRRAARAINGGD